MRIIIDIEERDERFTPDVFLEAVKSVVDLTLFRMIEAKNWKVYEEEQV